MEELYSETYIKEAKLTPQKKIQRIGLIALAVILIAFGLLAAITMGTVLVLLVMVVAAGIAIFFVPTEKLSYEYIFVDGQIDFDRILRGESRKTMKRIDLSKVEVVAPDAFLYYAIAIKSFFGILHNFSCNPYGSMV